MQEHCCSRYQGQEGFAPATYLKKSNDPYAKSLIEKSRQSGVQIISNLAAVSNLITSSSPRNSGVFTSNSSPGNSTTTPATAASSGQGEGEDDEDVVTSKPEPLAKMMMKQRSLERGGSLKPPPRQNSIKVSELHCVLMQWLFMCMCFCFFQCGSLGCPPTLCLFLLHCTCLKIAILTFKRVLWHMLI